MSTVISPSDYIVDLICLFACTVVTPAAMGLLRSKLAPCQSRPVGPEPAGSFRKLLIQWGQTAFDLV